MFKQSVIDLLQGSFICEQTNPAMFRWLKEQENQTDVEDYLSRINRRLVMTNNGFAYYCAWGSIGQDERADVKKIFIDIKHSIAPVVIFLKMCMNHSKQDISPAAGDRLNYASLLTTITENPNVLEELRGLATLGKEFVSQDSSPKGMLDRVIKQMMAWGYLTEHNKNQASYSFTGKLDYFYEVLTFLAEDEKSIQSAEDEQGTPVQGRLT
jgi:hypothetical protein